MACEWDRSLRSFWWGFQTSWAPIAGVAEPDSWPREVLAQNRGSRASVPFLGLREITGGLCLTLSVWHTLQILMYLKVFVMLFFQSPLPLTSVNYREEFFKNIIEDKERCY